MADELDESEQPRVKKARRENADADADTAGPRGDETDATTASHSNSPESEYRWLHEQLVEAQPCTLLLQQLQAAAQGSEDGEGVQAEEGPPWLDPTGGPLTRLLHASSCGDESTAQQLLASPRSWDINSTGPDGDSALHCAALYGHLGVVRLLLAAGARACAVNPQDNSTPLHDAAASGELELLQLLLGSVAGDESLSRAVNSQDEDGDTPLHNAARGGHAEVVALLLQHGARAECKNFAGQTAMDEADGDEAVQAALSRGPDGSKPHPPHGLEFSTR
ncbi:hypothetical protein QJQ45_004796 [Haematococcus lacustris]|nr:hypothetical protein QJQ45_004796 [Haematococcus lacustris]